jgi:hypothetical protein
MLFLKNRNIRSDNASRIRIDRIMIVPNPENKVDGEGAILREFCSQHSWDFLTAWIWHCLHKWREATERIRNQFKNWLPNMFDIMSRVTCFRILEAHRQRETRKDSMRSWPSFSGLNHVLFPFNG